jgi:multiple sugar transport system ATP-binding protein
VALEWAGKIWVGVTHRRVPARVGVRLPFGFQAADIHLFDAATGRSLRRGPRPP